jgi:aspartyl-tRNA(Asn)/glutamyl-tRNA(Gln) amidotransferase subunit A
MTHSSLDALLDADAVQIAAAIRQRTTTATQVLDATYHRIARRDRDFNCFTHLFTKQARIEAEAIDHRIEQGEFVGQLAGVPFAVKNLFDVAGLPTLAGSKIQQDAPPATRDATAIERMKQEGAILIGTLNMDEYAYGFVTENAHYGATHNPHDLRRVAGGSSGGSAAAVAGGLVPITLGSDTNGSIRVPAALCGVWGMKPTYGRLSRAGTFPFVNSLDHVGAFTRSVRDMAVVFETLQGADDRDPVCTNRLPESCADQLDRGVQGLRLAIAQDYFRQGATDAALSAVDWVAQVLHVKQSVVIPEAHRARAAAYLITASEGGNLHLETLRKRPQDFDPATRDRLIAGAMIPNAWYLQAQRFRRWYGDRLRELFHHVDVILTPTTPCVAPFIGQAEMTINGSVIAPRAHLGVYTQPISFVGLPVLSVPIGLPSSLPLGVQLIAAPYQEALLLRVAAELERQGVASARVA